MVRALLAGRKTQTRRVVTSATGLVNGNSASRTTWAKLDFGQAFVDGGPSPAGNAGPYLQVPFADDHAVYRVYPKWQFGDQLWVREAWGMASTSGYRVDPCITYRADGKQQPLDPKSIPADYKHRDGWRPSIFMPRWASRLTLEVTDVRVERVQACSDVDARAEGIPQTSAEATALGLFDNSKTPGHEWDNRTSVENYAILWDSINASRGFSWVSNPWVFAISFSAVEARK